MVDVRVDRYPSREEARHFHFSRAVASVLGSVGSHALGRHFPLAVRDLDLFQHYGLYLDFLDCCHLRPRCYLPIQFREGLAKILYVSLCCYLLSF